MHNRLFTAVILLSLVGCSASRSEVWNAPDLMPVTFHKVDSPTSVSLVLDGKPMAHLCLMGRVDPMAVQELQRCLKIATGTELPVLTNEIKEPAIVIGDVAEIETKQLPAEGLVIKTAPGRIYLTGNGAGKTWAIYEFLERYVGARWYYPGDMGRSVPVAKSLAVPAVYLTDAPVYQMRELWPVVSNPKSGNGTDMRGLHQALRSGNSWPINLQVHTPNYAKNEDYKQNRPEIFQLSDNGERSYEMLCYSNPRTLETFLENIQKRLDGERNINIGIQGKTITVSPNDHEIGCSCADCRKLWDYKAGAEGSASRVVATFTQKLALEVKKLWPDMTVLQLAYLNYTQCPEGIELPDNVRIMLCGMPGMALYSQPAIFDREQANVDKWVKLTGKKIQNWLYLCWPEDRTSAVFLHPHTLQKYYRLNRDKTVGSFINGGTDHWQRQGLNCYAWLKVLWNPDFDVDAAIDEYCRRMYGPASGSMRKLISMQIDGWENHPWPTPRLTARNVYTYSYPKAVRDEMKGLLEAARAQAAGDDLVLNRIAYYAVPFEDFFREGDESQNPGPRTVLNIIRADHNPTIDGKLDEAIWAKAPAVSFGPGQDRKQKTVKYPTHVRAVWTDGKDGGVTLAFDCTDTAPARIKHPNIDRDHPDALWDEDCVELLFDPSGKNDGDYYHFMVSAGNGISDAHGDDVTFNSSGTRVASHVTPAGYTLEIFIPFTDFPGALHPSPGKSVTWFGNLTRHRVGDYDRKKKVPGTSDEYQRLNTTYAGPSNNLADFGPWRFIDSP